MFGCEHGHETGNSYYSSSEVIQYFTIKNILLHEEVYTGLYTSRAVPILDENIF